MLSSSFVSILLVWGFSLRISGHFIDSLPQCWQDCIAANSNCEGSKCICRASRQGSFLPDTVACARSDCDDFDIDDFLDPLSDDCPNIPNSILSSASYEATETSDHPSHASTSRPEHYTETSQPHSRSAGDVTNTAKSTAASTRGQSSSSASATSTETTVVISPSPAATNPTTTATQDGQDSQSSTTSSKKPKHTGGDSNNGNGSPFSNEQAAASTWKVSVALVGLGLAIGLLRL